MAITFNSEGCRIAANDLLNSANNLNTILNVELTSLLEKVKKVYGGESAEQLYAALNKMKNEFPESIKPITEYSNYLTATVVPAYEKIEATLNNAEKSIN